MAHTITAYIHNNSLGSYLALLNSSVLLAPGRYDYFPIGRRNAIKIWHEAYQKESFIGHKSTAHLLRKLLKDDTIKVNREPFRFEPGEAAIVFKLRKRPKEKKIWKIFSYIKVFSEKEIEKIGYDFRLMYCVKNYYPMAEECKSKEEYKEWPETENVECSNKMD